MGTRRKPSAGELNLGPVAWRKASGSDNQGECVRVAQHGPHTLLDDSKAPSPRTGDALVLASAEWHAFHRALRT